MRARLALPLICILFAGCGRGEVTPLGNGDGQDAGPTEGVVIWDSGPRDAGPLPGDAQPQDTAPIPTDAEPQDFGPMPDGGVQCVRPRDCFQSLGPPPRCPNGRGDWICVDNACEVSCPESCATDCDCDFGLACESGACQPVDRRNECCFNPDCPAGQSCVYPNGIRDFCPGDTPDGGPPPPTDGGPPPPFDGGPFPTDGGPPPPDAGVPTTPVGDACVGNDCGPVGFCIDQSQGFPGGYCSQGCAPGQASCPAGSECMDFGQGSSVCVDSCVSNAECRTDYACVQLGLSMGRVCWPRSNTSTNPMGDPVGAGCTVDNDCVQGLSCVDSLGFPGGYCSLTYCDSVTNPCPSGSACYAFPGLYSLCMADCPSGGSQSTCRSQYYCFGPSNQPGACFPN